MTTALDPLAVPLGGAHLIEASAGTGKTHTITTLFVRLIVEQHLVPRDILVVTYTVAATAELRRRVRERLRAAGAAFAAPEAPTGDAVLDALVASRRAAGELEADGRHLGDALRAFDEAAILTIHGFCLRVLQDCAFESKAAFASEFLADPKGLLLEIARDFWTQSTVDAPAELIEYLRAKRYGPEGLCRLARQVTRDPAMRLVPTLNALGDVDLDSARAAWRAAIDSAGAMWTQQRGALQDLLCESPALNRNKYQVKSIRGTWLPALDDLFARPRPGVLDGTWVDKLTPDGIVAGTNKKQTAPAHPFFAMYADLRAADTTFADALERRAKQLELQLCAYARAELPRRKHRLGVRSYDDLLYDLVAALGESGDGESGAALVERVRQRYRAALIDEFQDTDAAQYALFERLFGEAGSAAPTSWFLIGDPKQAIYGFRGADIFAYVGAKKNVGGAGALTLAVNWRSDPRLLRGINAVFGGARAPFLIDGVDFVPAVPRPAAVDRLAGGGAAVRVLWQPRGTTGKRWNKDDARAAARAAVAGDIARLLGSGATIDGESVRPADVAVLCRTNDMAKEIQPHLRRLGIPSVLQGDASVFREGEAAQLQAVLAAVAEPGVGGALEAALATPIFGLDATAVADLETDEPQWDLWVERFRRWQRVWDARGFIQTFRLLVTEADVARRLLGFDDGERRLTNLLHLGELLQGVATERRLGPAALAEWLARTRADPVAFGDVGDDVTRLRLESDADAVRLTTIHKSKGLQYPIVYCAELWNGMLAGRPQGCGVRFHDAVDGALSVDLCATADSQSTRAANWEAYAENLRLAYVALTRAQHQCTIVWGGFRGIEHSGLAYLLHQPATPPGELGSDWATSVQQHVANLDDATMAEDLAALVARGGGDVAVSTIEEAARQAGSRWRARGRDGAVRLHGRQLSTVVPRGRTVASFTALTAHPGDGGGGAAGRLSSASAEGFDYDGSPAGDDDGAEETGVVAATEPEIPLADLPAGAATGIMIHELLEHLDFATATPERLGEIAAAALARHGMAGHFAAALAAGLGDLLAAPLPGGFCLGDIPKSRRLDELEFLYPAGRGDVGLTPARLAAPFARHPDPRLAAYGDRLARLTFLPAAGFLKGYIDLAFCHDERWYVVDYKSNFLGRRAADYAPPHLDRAMAAHHYILQYHLYVLAVHRYLGARLAGYSYNQHFGGVFYLFVRGTGPTRPERGIYFDRPPVRLIEALAEGLGVEILR